MLMLVSYTFIVVLLELQISANLVSYGQEIQLQEPVIDLGQVYHLMKMVLGYM